MTLSLGTVLLHGDSGSINFEEYKKRITPQRASVGGIQQLRWLVQHQKECPALMALLGKIYIDFPAIVVASRGMCYSPYCNQGGLLWVDRWFWLGYGFNSLGRIAFGR